MAQNINIYYGYVECPCGHKDQVLKNFIIYDEGMNPIGAYVDWDDAETNKKIYEGHCLKCNTWRSLGELEPVDEAEDLSYINNPPTEPDTTTCEFLEYV